MNGDATAIIWEGFCFIAFLMGRLLGAQSLLLDIAHTLSLNVTTKDFIFLELGTAIKEYRNAS